MGEAQLLVAARDGGAGAFSELITRYSPRLLRLAITITRDLSAAEDAVEEALLSAWRGLSGCRGVAALSTLPHTITVRAATRIARSDSWQVMRATDELWADERYTVDPLDVLAAASRAEELTAAFNRLPLIYRQALVLHDVQGLTAAQVAVITRAPLGTAKARIRRGRAALITDLTTAERQPHNTGLRDRPVLDVGLPRGRTRRDARRRARETPGQLTMIRLAGVGVELSPTMRAPARPAKIWSAT